MTTHGAHGPNGAILAQQGWLRRLAVDLVGVGTAAEDLVQETLVAALEHPPQQEGALRTWLRTVLVNRARTRATTEGRRRGREALVARTEAVGGPHEILERLDLARRVAEALAELPEAERRALYLRYYEDLRPPEVARALGLPLGTVKSHLARGRELLRRRLDHDCGGRQAWLVALLPPAHPAAPPPSPSPALPAPGAATAGSTWIGALAMGTKTTTGLVAGALLVASLIVWRPWEARPDALPIGPEPVALDPPGPRGDARDGPAVRDAAPRTAQRVEAVLPPDGAPQRTGRVELAATHAADGSAAALLGGLLAPESEAWREAPRAARAFALDAGGRAALGDLEPGRWVARLDGRSVAGAAVEVVAGETAQVELSIQIGLGVRGLVLDDRGRPVPAAEVFLARDGDVPGSGTLARTDGLGRFALRDLAPWRQTGPYTALAARAPGRVSSPTWEAIGAVGSEAHIILHLGPQAGALRGRVVDPRGVPVVGARIRLESAAWSSAPELSPEGWRLNPPPALRLGSGPEGEFASDRLPPGGVAVSVEVDEHPKAHRECVIEAGRTTELEVVLEVGGVLEGVVLDPRGDPAEGASLRVDVSGEQPLRATTDAAGRYRIGGLRAGPAQVRAAFGFGREVRGEVSIAAGASTRWDARLVASERASGRLLDEAGAPLAGWGVHVIEPTRSGLWLVSARTDAEGRFQLENCPEGPKALEVRLPSPFAAPPLLVVPFPEEPDVDLIVPDRARPSATLAGRVVDPDGADVQGLEVWLGAKDQNWSQLAVPDRTTQAFSYGPLAPGPYWLSLRAPGYFERQMGGIELAPGERRDLGILELERGCLLEVALETQSGVAAEPRAIAQLVAPNGKVRGAWHLDGLTWRSELLAPGEWLLRLGGPGMAQRELPLRLEAGRTTSVAVEVEPGTSRSLVLEGLAEGDRQVSLEVLDERGERFGGPVTQFGPHVGVHGLTLGRWRVVARAPSGRSGALELRVESLAPTSDTLSLVLR